MEVVPITMPVDMKERADEKEKHPLAGQYFKAGRQY